MKKDLRAVWMACIFIFNLYGSVNAQNFTESNLPIIVIDTWGKNIDAAWQNTMVWMSIIDNGAGNTNHLSDAPNNYNGRIMIKLRGQSALSFPKKSFRITTVNEDGSDNKVSILGMPKDEDWVLDGIYQDKSLLRDALAFKIFREMGKYSSRTRFVELVVNGDYRGVYAVDEKIKRDSARVDVSKLKTTDIAGDKLTGGYIVKLDKTKWYDEGWHSNYNSDDSGDSTCFWVYHYPDPDSMMPQQKDYIKSYVDSFETVMNGGDYKDVFNGYRKYIDVNSFIDMFILTELSRNIDGYRLSSYFFKDKYSKGGKLHAGPAWDYDIAWGNCANSGGNNPYWWQYPQSYHTNFIPFWWERLMDDANFKYELKCRWQELRSGVLSPGKLFVYIDSMAAVLDAAQERNFQRWPIMDQVIPPSPSPAPGSYEEEIDELKDWIATRIGWMDDHITGQCFTGVEELNAKIIDVYPNPFSDAMHLTYDQPGTSEVRIELYNALGSLVQNIYSGKQEAGLHNQVIQTSSLEPGIYILKLSINGKEFNTKMVKAR